MLREYGKATVKRPTGDGWFTLEELADEERKQDPTVTVEAIRYRIKQAKQHGVTVEVAAGSIADRDGKVHRTNYYRITTGPRKNGKTK